MKMISLSILLWVLAIHISTAQVHEAEKESQSQIKALIDNYTQARESKDRELLDRILTSNIDQLVSSGTWRRGKEESMKGMLRSSTNNPGKRTITVDHIRFIAPGCAIADARYEIENADGSVRKMWSSFVVVQDEDEWKITAIRNMKPGN